MSLRTRLILAVVSIVALILIAIGLATGTLLSRIMQDNLDAQISRAMDEVRGPRDATAAEILSSGRQEVGTLLVLRTVGTTTGAYVATDDQVVELSDEVIAGLTGKVDQLGWGTVSIDSAGEYRVRMVGDLSSAFVMVGLPTSEVAATLGRIVTTVALVTAGGLFILAAVIAIVIRRALRPLTVVADTATRVAALPLSEGDVVISERVPAEQADEKSEIGRVGAALNTLLDHVDSSLHARQRNEERMRRFVADASHELRTPLASIRGYSELSLRALGQSRGDAAREAATAPQTEQALERIQAQSLRMTTLVEDLLLLARLDEGQELVHGTVDLTRLAVEALGDARPAGPQHRWVLEVPDKPVVITGDAGRLQQVAVNLLANARVHTPEGTEVTMSVAREGDEAVLRVHDNGPGIDPKIAAELFERFSRADTSRARQTGGTGLGLSIARAIVEAHHGSITADSRPGDTTFTVRLPAV